MSSGQRVLVGLLVLSVLLGAWWFDSAGNPFPELERAASSFPAPREWTLDQTERVGAVCRLRPSCTTPQYTLTYRVNPPTSCDAVHSLFQRWRKKLATETVYDDDHACLIQGTGARVRFSVLVSASEAEAARTSSEVTRVTITVVKKG
ncbi:MAG: hypothetical protein JWO68_407 [Actinomycetia bacterium]|nr:hypothetical protein [Actinomycetes bacterium]